MNDYITESHSEWVNPWSIYKVELVYQWKHNKTGTTGTNKVRVTSVDYAHSLIENWNAPIYKGFWTYSVIRIS